MVEELKSDTEINSDRLYDSDNVIDDSENDIEDFKYSITSYGADYPVDTLVKRLNEKIIFIPNFQRKYVWKLNQASRFIESLLLGLPVPGIFLSKEKESQKLLVIDGQQRLKTLEFFYDGIFSNNRPFSLTGVQSIFEGKTYKMLTPEDKRRLDDSIIHATVVKQDEPDDDESSIYFIFERLNTGGTTLQPQEVRACIYWGDFNDLLVELNKLKEWRKIFGNESIRLKDQELILRFFALYYDIKNYIKPLKSFLNYYMGKNRNFKCQTKAELSNLFTNTIQFIGNNIEKAFRRDKAIIAAVYDSIMIGVARRLATGSIINIEEFKKCYSELLYNLDFINFTTKWTSDLQSVNRRIDLASNAFKNIK